jgi:hypothetical protein
MLPADLSVQGTSLKSKLSSKLAVFDVASSFIWAPKADADAFWAAVPGSTFSQTESLYQWRELTVLFNKFFNTAY